MTSESHSPDPARCPVTGQPATEQGAGPARASRTSRQEPVPNEAIKRDATGVYRVHSFQAARDILRSEGVRQAGFMAEAAGEMGGRTPLMTRMPVLFAEGEEHHEMRRATARYFTPAAVGAYQPMIAALADDLMAQLVRQGEANLDDLSLHLGVNVAARVVGLTSSRLPGMEKRITAFVEGPGNSEPGAAQPSGRLESARQQAHLGLFYLLDVKPAIRARRKARRDDLISYLLDRGYNDLEIMTECLTYGTAGMVTTREFITVAAWHLLKSPGLRADYVHGTEKQRYDILHEILRLEPVVGTLYRRAQTELTVGDTVIPPGSLLALNVQHANLDPQVAGDSPEQLCPARPLPRGVQPPVLSFGDGHHRCPGAFLAIKESDVFLRRVLLWQDLELVQEPQVTYNEVVKGFELRGLRVRLGRRA
ncbi:cytochrome P450 [Deinococcus deserti]|uniref:Putative Cytochrome P450 n=1 Tax=Deinococcus deserti (strain DSM 17065 / CIP 109153 / LMG 22923 / VCD115) TaxID=546414 RepID=C1CYE3_DEIDV|nr:cytochrome P450 [Deinococcus deserti]ACO44964.1 putative Cytochrome P450 [Deinococcus deserti VCD115]